MGTGWRRGGHIVEVADHGNPPGVAVESAGVEPFDRLGEAAGATLEHLAVLVDEGVVRDVTPAQGLAVVSVDGFDYAGGLQRRVVVAPRGVVDHRGTNPPVVLRCFASQ